MSKRKDLKANLMMIAWELKIVKDLELEDLKQLK